MTADVESRGINVVRGLAMDAPHRARSGHQGTAMALAPLAHVLFTRVMTYDAADPRWPDRDRFVLSAGHASILQYAMLYLTGFGLELDDLRAFRQWGSATPGHPEVGHTAGVETTTGPLGQGFANAVGLAIAERWLRSRFSADVCNHSTFVICGDGDLAEGLSHEAASLAGHQQLGRLIAVYDDNHVSIDGPTELALSDDAAARFESYGWHVENLGEIADDLDGLEAALARAKAVDDAPSLLVLRSHIGFPSPDHTDDPGAHGYVFKDDEIASTKAAMGLPVDESFHVPDDVVAYYREAGQRGRQAREAWIERLDAWDGDREAYDACMSGVPADGWSEALPMYDVESSIATRKASQAGLAAAADALPGLIAGAADLTGNTGTKLAATTPLSAADPAGRQLYYGVREHGMGGIMNGLALHGGIVPVGGTFLVFSDYMRAAVRLAALMGLKVIYSWSHDSVGVGEDGPTHQPVEQIAALRLIPGLQVIRPADGNETAAAWMIAAQHDGPTALVLSRQDVPTLAGTGAYDDVARGGYVLDRADDPDVVLVGTGSELQHCVVAAGELAADGIVAQVVSLPCWSRFDSQSADYRDSVLPPGVPA
ncbi:MAG: transketolase, partial [Acidimicrobiia bacterium]|nr:transketolase [Acidimicrobiia bacterium]